MAQSLVKSCIISRKGGVPLGELNKDYKELVGEDIPFKASGFQSLKNYLLSIKGITITNDIVVATSDKTAHLEKMINKQKDPKRRLIRKGNSHNKENYSALKHIPNKTPQVGSSKREFRENSYNFIPRVESRRPNFHQNKRSYLRSIQNYVTVGRQTYYNEVNKPNSNKNYNPDEWISPRNYYENYWNNYYGNRVNNYYYHPLNFVNHTPYISSHVHNKRNLQYTYYGNQTSYYDYNHHNDDCFWKYDF